jgi:CRP/FNR family transcriptional regulator, dissimilatory nitrate respiration regulator
MKVEHETIARQSLLLSNAPASIVAVLLSRATVSEVERGNTIFAQDEPADAIFIVIDGWVKLFRISPAGSEAVVGVFTKGHSFGEAVALRQSTYPVFAETVTDCTLMRIDAQELLRQLHDSPEVAISMLTATYAHLHNMVAQIEQLKAQTGPQRVADFLLELTRSKFGACSVQLPYDKVLIAGRLGMKPESLSRAFSKLKDQGVKVHQNSAEIEDIESLRAYAERDRAVSWHHD